MRGRSAPAQAPAGAVAPVGARAVPRGCRARSRRLPQGGLPRASRRRSLQELVLAGNSCPCADPGTQQRFQPLPRQSALRVLCLSCVCFFFFPPISAVRVEARAGRNGPTPQHSVSRCPETRTPLTKGCASQPAASLPWSGRFGTARQTSGLPAISTLLDTITKRKASQKPQRARPSSPALPSQPAPCPPCNRACAVAKLKCFHTLSLPNVQQSTSLDAVCLLDPLLLGVTHLSSVAGEDP